MQIILFNEIQYAKYIQLHAAKSFFEREKKELREDLKNRIKRNKLMLADNPKDTLAKNALGIDIAKLEKLKNENYLNVIKQMDVRLLLDNILFEVYNDPDINDIVEKQLPYFIGNSQKFDKLDNPIEGRDITTKDNILIILY